MNHEVSYCLSTGQPLDVVRLNLSWWVKVPRTASVFSSFTHTIIQTVYWQSTNSMSTAYNQDRTIHQQSQTLSTTFYHSLGQAALLVGNLPLAFLLCKCDKMDSDQSGTCRFRCFRCLFCPILHCDLCAAGLTPNVGLLGEWNSLERSDLRSRWGHSSLSWFHGSGSLWRFQLFKHSFQTDTWDCCFFLFFSLELGNNFFPSVAAPPMEKGWQCWQAVHRFFFAFSRHINYTGEIISFVGFSFTIFHYRSTLDTLGARGHGTWHVFSQCEGNRVLLGPKIQGRLASIQSRRALASDPLVVLSCTFDKSKDSKSCVISTVPLDCGDLAEKTDINSSSRVMAPWPCKRATLKVELRAEIWGDLLRKVFSKAFS